MGYRLNHLDEPVFMAVPKPMLIEFGIDWRVVGTIGMVLLSLFSWQVFRAFAT